MELKVIDGIIKEPVGGAHRNYDEAARLVKEQIVNSLAELSPVPPDTLIDQRILKYEKMGFYKE